MPAVAVPPRPYAIGSFAHSDEAVVSHELDQHRVQRADADEVDPGTDDLHGRALPSRPTASRGQGPAVRRRERGISGKRARHHARAQGCRATCVDGVTGITRSGTSSSDIGEGAHRGGQDRSGAGPLSPRTPRVAPGAAHDPQRGASRRPPRLLRHALEAVRGRDRRAVRRIAGRLPRASRRRPNHAHLRPAPAARRPGDARARGAQVGVKRAAPRRRRPDCNAGRPRAPRPRSGDRVPARISIDRGEAPGAHQQRCRCDHPRAVGTSAPSRHRRSCELRRRSGDHRGAGARRGLPVPLPRR